MWLLSARFFRSVGTRLSRSPYFFADSRGSLPTLLFWWMGCIGKSTHMHTQTIERIVDDESLRRKSRSRAWFPFLFFRLLFLLRWTTGEVESGVVSLFFSPCPLAYFSLSNSGLPNLQRHTRGHITHAQGLRFYCVSAPFLSSGLLNRSLSFSHRQTREWITC